MAHRREDRRGNCRALVVPLVAVPDEWWRLIDPDPSGHVQPDLFGLLDREQQARGSESGSAKLTETCAGMGKRDPEKPAGLPIRLPILLPRVRRDILRVAVAGCCS